MRLWLVCCGLLLCACTTPEVTRNSAPQKVQFAGDQYLISELTAGTWIAVAQSTGKPVPRSSMGKAALLNAIAQTSGCKVTDANYSRDGLQLDAQIDCGGKPAN